MLRIIVMVVLYLLTFKSIWASSFPVKVHSCGQILTFDSAPKRAVINDINMLQMALALDLQPYLVGVTGISGWHTITPELKQQLGIIPELASKYPTLENLLVASPDFFFAGWNYGMNIGGEITPQILAMYGITTLVLSESCIWVDRTRPRASMDLLYGDVLTLGTIFGQAEKAQALVAKWKEQLNLFQQKNNTRQPINVFLYDADEDKPFTAGKYAMPTALIEAAGGKNIMDTLEASWTTTSWESVALHNPELIILVRYKDGEETVTANKAFLAAHPLMRLTHAVQQQRYLVLNYAEITPGPANIGAIVKLAQALYPD